MLLVPVGKDYLWGGERLKTEYSKKIDVTPLAETWECSTHPDGPSVVANGVFAGKTLTEVLAEHPSFLGNKNQWKTKAAKRSERTESVIPADRESNVRVETGAAGLECSGTAEEDAADDENAAGQLPILVKFIDAAKDLSVQVHPDDRYAAEFENGQNGKTEFWYVLDAVPGAELVYGFEHPVTPELLRRAVAEGTLMKHLHRVPVHKGDVFYIPAGTVHAIGKGVLVAEVQESSNLTYRVYDYDRVGADGKKRELHFDKAMNVLDMKPVGDVRQKSRCVRHYPGTAREIICRCRYFDAEEIRTNCGFEFNVLENSFQVILMLDGSCVLRGKVSAREFRKGDCIFIPAGTGRYEIKGECRLLKIRC